MVDCCRREKVFGEETDAVGRSCIPVEIKVLGALRTLGRATLHDDVAEISGAGSESHRMWFLKFIRFVSSRFKNEFICIPNETEFESIQRMYGRLGFPNCVGSMDATHLHWMNCPQFAMNDHTGKEGFPTLAFNVVVVHSGRIIHVGSAFPGARNDKTIVRLDDFANRMRFGGLYADLEASLYKNDGSQCLMKGYYL